PGQRPALLDGLQGNPESDPSRAEGSRHPDQLSPTDRAPGKAAFVRRGVRFLYILPGPWYLFNKVSNENAMTGTEAKARPVPESGLRSCKGPPGLSLTPSPSGRRRAGRRPPLTGPEGTESGTCGAMDAGIATPSTKVVPRKLASVLWRAEAFCFGVACDEPADRDQNRQQFPRLAGRRPYLRARPVSRGGNRVRPAGRTAGARRLLGGDRGRIPPSRIQD